MFAIAVVPAALLGIGMTWAPESPSWLFKVSATRPRCLDSTCVLVEKRTSRFAIFAPGKRSTVGVSVTKSSSYQGASPSRSDLTSCRRGHKLVGGAESLTFPMLVFYRSAKVFIVAYQRSNSIADLCVQLRSGLCLQRRTKS
jgi:hypothetical protein